MPHTAVPPAQFAGGALCTSHKVCMGRRGPHPHPLRRRWQGWLGVIADGRLWRVSVRRWCIRARAGCTSAASWGGAKEGKGVKRAQRPEPPPLRCLSHLRPLTITEGWRLLMSWPLL